MEPAGLVSRALPQRRRRHGADADRADARRLARDRRRPGRRGLRAGRGNPARCADLCRRDEPGGPALARPSRHLSARFRWGRDRSPRRSADRRAGARRWARRRLVPIGLHRRRTGPRAGVVSVEPRRRRASGVERAVAVRCLEVCRGVGDLGLGEQPDPTSITQPSTLPATPGAARRSAVSQHFVAKPTRTLAAQRETPRHGRAQDLGNRGPKSSCQTSKAAPFR